MWWETHESMTQESREVEIDVDMANTDVLEAKATNDEVGVVEEVLS